jgi:hypothetical protein
MDLANQQNKETFYVHTGICIYYLFIYTPYNECKLQMHNIYMHAYKQTMVEWKQMEFQESGGCIQQVAKNGNGKRQSEKGKNDDANEVMKRRIGGREWHK